MTNPTYVLVKLLDPVGPDDAQNVARHLVQSLEFADVESAQPVVYDGVHSTRPLVARFALVGEEVSLVPRAEPSSIAEVTDHLSGGGPSALSHLDNEAGARAWRKDT